MTDALVLAGGGTKAAFEVGALMCLSRQADYAPGIISGTSAGSMIAATLAQARDGAEFQHLVGVVHGNVLAVSDMNVVFGKQHWLQAVEGTPFASIVEEVLAQGTRPTLPGLSRRESVDKDAAATVRRKRALSAMTAAIGHAPSVIRAGRTFLHEGHSLLSLDPLEASLRGQRDIGIEAVDEPRVAAAGIVLRLTIAALGDGIARYVNQSGHVLQADSHTIHEPGGRPGVVEGVLASSSVPMVFPPRRIGDDSYCDGGVVQNVPVEAAVLAGAGDVTTLLASPLHRPREDVDYSQASLMAVYSRAVSGVAQLEAQRAQLRYPVADGARHLVIAPTVEVVGSFEVEPGLIGIATDYGWLRAAEVLAEVPDPDLARISVLSDHIAVHRALSWQLENRLLGVDTDQVAESTLAQARREVAESARDWRASGLPAPPGLDRWGLEWESHRVPIPAELASFGLP